MTVRPTHVSLDAATGRRLRFQGLFTEPVLVEQITQEGDVLFVRVRTTDGRPDEITLEPAELHAALEHAPPGPSSPGGPRLLRAPHRS
ncbi:MAG: hypothetical protein HC884_17160 [Chloroflexaceae bacterium]|nr:hypothetical protein [Chloroflexaceae bacterium]